MLNVRCKGYEGKLHSMGLFTNWDNETGEYVPTGTYYVRIELDGNTDINLQNVKAEEIEIFDE